MKSYIYSSLLKLIPVMVLAGFLTNTALACANSDPTSPVGIVPVLVSGNTPAESLINVKIDPPNAGTYALGTGSVTISFVDGPCGEVMTWSVSGNIVIDHVYAKGGPDYNDYDYTGKNPRPVTDGNLHCPINTNGFYPDFSHVNFVFHYKLDVSKTAATEFTRTYLWDIEKSVSPDTWNFFCGDEGTSDYTVNVTSEGFTDSGWKVTGMITIENNTPFSATITSVADVLSDLTVATVNCDGDFELAASETLTCTYTAYPPDGDPGTNTVTVTTSTPLVKGDVATAGYSFVNPTTEVNKTVNVEDDQYTPDDPWVVTYPDDGVFTYSRKFDCEDENGVSVCPDGSYNFENTATIVETGQNDDAEVTVNCYSLSVTKTADTELDRTWTWTIDKTCDDEPLTLSVGQTYTVSYTIEVDATSEDDNWKVTGDIEVYNPAPIDATINTVADLVSPGIAATVDCGVTFPYTLAAGATLSCTYSADLPDAAARVNTATASLQNYSDDTPSGTTDFSGSAAVNFGSATVHEIDECADISDSYAGALGTVCYGDLPKTFTYERELSFDECGEYTVENTASFKTNDTATEGSDDCSIPVSVPCQGGCTLTQGYWKTHSEFGPAPYHETWGLLPNGASTPFFLSGQTYYQVLWTSPAGNAYYNLAHQYIAAKLNQLNGASIPPAVLTAFNAATVLLNTYTPAQIGALKASSAIRKQFVSLAGILDNYNNGITGPGHCSDDSNGYAGKGTLPGVNLPQTEAFGSFNLAPNPAGNEVLIDLSEFIGKSVDIRVFNSLGSQVWRRTFNSLDTPTFNLGLDQPVFSNGVFLVTLNFNGKRITKTLIVHNEK